MSTFVPIKEDVVELLSTYDTNPAITFNQRKKWTPSPEGSGMDPGHLACDHPNALILLEADGFDGQPVTACPSALIARFFDYGEIHHFLSGKDLLRLGLFFGLDFYHIVALVLKGEWERTYALEEKGWRPASGLQLSDVLLGVQEKDLTQTRFNPNTAELFRMLEGVGHLPIQAGCDEDSFDQLIQEMLMAGLHWTANGSRELETFAQNERSRVEMLRSGTPEEREAFWQARCLWAQQLNEFDEVTMRVEARRLQNEEIQRRWLCLFGKQDLELKELTDKQFILDRRINLLEANPECTPEEIVKRVVEDEAQREKALADFRATVSMAPMLSKAGANGVPMDGEDIAKYQEDCHKLLRQIYLKIHTDRLMGNKIYQQLSESARKKLEGILQATLDIKPEELGYPDGFVQAQFRSREGLQRVLRNIDVILANAGLETRCEMLIQGKTIGEQRAWMEQECAWIEKAIQEGKARLGALDDELIRQKKDIVDHSERHAAVQQELAKRVSEAREEVNRLDKGWQSLIDLRRREQGGQHNA